MTSTFEKYNGTRRGNYCTLPSQDVEILTLTPVCDRCDGALVYSGSGIREGWKHVDATCCDHYPRKRTVCSYCGTDEKGVVTFSQRSYSDETECTRCGGIRGYAIGD